LCNCDCYSKHSVFHYLDGIKMTPEELVSAIIENIQKLEIFRSQGFYGAHGRIGKIWVNVTLSYHWDDSDKITFEWIDVWKYVNGQNDWWKYYDYKKIVNIGDDLVPKNLQKDLIKIIVEEHQKKFIKKKEQEKKETLKKIKEIEI